MREIIPLKKDIVFKTSIGVITNIEVDHDYKVKDDIVEGNLIVSGTYKMTEASVLDEEYYYKIPFSVALSKNVKKDTIQIEIDDFRYNTSKDIMSIEADLEFKCEEESEEGDFLEEYFKEDEGTNEQDNEKEEVEVENKEVNIEENINNITTNIINNENKYYTYKVYIVRNGDTIESICNKYNITLEDLKEYNDITNIHEGDKIIIPSFNE